jgi:hypothetical protein
MFQWAVSGKMGNAEEEVSRILEFMVHGIGVLPRTGGG